MRIISCAALAIVVTFPALAADTDGKAPPDRAPSLMTPTEIRAYNEGLDFNHPYYIRCTKDPVMGSLVRKLRVCRTNEQWKQFRAQGEANGREILDEMSHAPVNSGPGMEPCANGHC